MVTVEDYSRLVSGIYAAATAPDHWELAIREIHKALGGTGGSLLTADGAIWSIQNSTIPEAAVTSYADHYCRLDHVLTDVAKGPVGVVRTGGELVIPNRHTEFYAGWLRPNELEDGLFARLTGGATPTCFLITSANRSESFDTPERVKVMSNLVPHLQQALRTQGRLAALTHSRADMTAALEFVRHGMVFVGSGGLVMHRNLAAERILRAADGVQIRAGCLSATNTYMEQKLQRAIHGAILDDDSDIRRGQTFTLHRPSDKRPYVIHVVPLHRSHRDQIPKEPTALVLIIDPEREPEPAAALLRRVYRLTDAEAKVAVGIVGGADLRQIAEQLSVSLTTVRTHLQHVFHKTGTHRQAELVRCLVALIP